MTALVAIERTAPLELRFDAPRRLLSGDVVQYDTARPVSGVGLELFRPDSLRPVYPVGINVLHGRDSIFASTSDRSLRLKDSPTELRIEADIEERSTAWWALTRKVARSLSLEFESVTEHRDQSGVRIITEARLTGIGLVDASPHRGRVELRHLEEMRSAEVVATLTSGIPSSSRLCCECSGPGVGYATFEEEAIDQMVALINGDTPVIATWKDYGTPLGSNTMARLRARRTDDGMDIEVDLPDTDSTRELLDASATTGIVARPYIAADAVSVVEGEGDGAVRIYRTAPLRAIVISATDAREGWPTPVIEQIVDEGVRHDRFRGARRLGAEDPVMALATYFDAGWLSYWLPDDFPDPDDRAHYLSKAARRAVERYAPSAPDDLQVEAFIRYASALATAAGPLNRHSTTSGDLSVRFVVDDAGLFRRCGAASLLSPYRIRRGLRPARSTDED